MSLAKQWNEERKLRLARLNGGRRRDDVSAADATKELRIQEYKNLVSELLETIEKQRETIIALSDPKQIATPKLADILNVVTKLYGISQRKLIGAARSKEIVRARYIACYLARELTPMSFAQIGRQLGDRDHTTIMHGYRFIRDNFYQEKIRSDLDQLNREIDLILDNRIKQFNEKLPA